MFKKLTQKLFPHPKHPAATALLVGTAVVLFWRGMWGILDLYLLPDNPGLSFIVSLFLGVGILYLTHHLVKELL